MPWVRLKTIKYLRDKGKTVIYHPGDSIEVSRRQALGWVLDGTAEDLYDQVRDLETLGDDLGVLVLADKGDFSSKLGSLSYKLGRLSEPLPYEHTFIWNPRSAIRLTLVNYGFLILKDHNWEAAATLKDFHTTAGHVGSDQDKVETEELIGDLRVALYNPNFIWVKNTPSGQLMLDILGVLLLQGVDPDHAFLRSAYSSQVMLCTLPFDWFGNRN